MLALSLINLCAREYQDIAFTRISKASWLDWLNDAQRAVVLVRPDANASTENLTLVAGTKQALPVGALRLLAPTRNMGANGTTVGRVVRLASHDAQDGVDLDWHTATAESPVREIFYDDKKDPLKYWVRPPAVNGWKVEAILSRTPTDVTDADAGLISLVDIYSGPLQAWMLYRAYAMATQALNQFQRANFYFNSFFNLLGVKIKAEMFVATATPGAFGQGAAAQAGR